LSHHFQALAIPKSSFSIFQLNLPLFLTRMFKEPSCYAIQSLVSDQQFLI